MIALVKPLTGRDFLDPADLEPEAAVVERARTITAGTLQVKVTSDPGAVHDATPIYTDVWASMGQEEQTDARRQAFAEYRVFDQAGNRFYAQMALMAELVD